MNVVTFDPREKEENRRKEDMLEVVEEIKRQIEEGKIKEFVAASLTVDGEAQVHASCLDLVGGVGMFEVGKHLLIENDRFS